MGIAGSPDIFQAKMLVLMAALEFVKIYLDDLLCITRASLDDHLEKLREVVTRLRDAGLEVNAQKSKFSTKETEYQSKFMEDHYLHGKSLSPKPTNSYLN